MLSSLVKANWAWHITNIMVWISLDELDYSFPLFCHHVVQKYDQDTRANWFGKHPCDIESKVKINPAEYSGKHAIVTLT